MTLDRVFFVPNFHAESVLADQDKKIEALSIIKRQNKCFFYLSVNLFRIITIQVYRSLIVTDGRFFTPHLQHQLFQRRRAQ